MDIKDKIALIKYHRSSSLVRFMIDLEKMVSKAPKNVQQNFRNEFANGCMVLTLKGVIGNITMDQYSELIKFIEINFGIKYTFTI